MKGWKRIERGKSERTPEWEWTNVVESGKEEEDLYSTCKNFKYKLFCPNFLGALEEIVLF